jgi:asparagine synthase (glutamine-hydrolysing)
VVAIMQAVSPAPVRTFTIGFREGQFNEAAYAKAIARHLGTDHTELYVTAEAALNIIPRLPAMYDEPFADSSQLPTFLVSELARSRVTVALSGDGGDEVFGGYVRYQWADSIWDAAERIPRPVRHMLGRGAEIAGAVSRFLPRLPVESRTNIGHRLRHIGNMIRVDTQDELYLAVVSNWYTPDQVVPGTAEPRLAMFDSSPFASITERIMLLDTVNYLPDDILVKLDRASMAVSLECRVPLLDAGLLEFAWRLPKRYRFREKKGKWILRQLLKRYVPEAMFERPKMGFAIPIDEWLRGPLRDWAEALLSERRLREEGMLEPGPVRTKWREHLQGAHNGQRYVWSVLMFQAWLEQARASRGEALALR